MLCRDSASDKKASEDLPRSKTKSEANVNGKIQSDANYKRKLD